MKRILVAIVAATMAVLLAGCGSDSSGDNTAGEPTVVNTSAAPSQVTWEKWQGVMLPVSAEDGPKKVAGDVASGYSATPQGAVLAAVQGVTRLRLAPDSSWPRVANTVAAPGLGRDAYAVNRAMITITGPVPEGAASTLRGFRVVEYTSERAVIELATEQPDATLVATTHTLLWSGNDWKLELPEPESETPTSRPLTDLGGFTEFEASA